MTITFHNLITALSLAIALTSPATQAADLKLMSYNIRNGMGIDDVTSLERVADVINAQAPDIVAVQEVDSVTHRTGGVYILGNLADMTGMQPSYAPAIDYDGGKYGIGILSRRRPQSVTRYALPGAEEARALIVVEMPEYIFAATHLSLTPRDCLASVEIIDSIAAEATKRAAKPFFVAGDFNSWPDSEVMRAFSRSFTPLTDTTLPTFPADRPVETIDYIMLYTPADSPKANGVASQSPESVTAKERSVVNAPAASDHRPVTVTVTL